VCKISSDVGKGSAHVGGLLVVVRHFLLAKNVLVAALQIKTQEYMRLIFISVYQRSTVHTPSFTAQFSRQPEYLIWRRLMLFGFAKQN
jgi:hypothetical protein